MPEKLTEVVCPLSDCLHHHVDPAKPGVVFCKHLDKEHYMDVQPCPLFRLNWQKKAVGSEDLLKTFHKKF